MKLVPIPEEKYEYYKQRLMFEGYKWDPQFVDNNTVAKYVLVLSEEEARTIAAYTDKLAKETMKAEQFINDNLDKAKALRLPKRLKKEIQSMTNYDPEKNIRLMRFDFHPTTDGGFAISEVNSDVPGGHAEGSVVPAIAKALLDEASAEVALNDKQNERMATYGYMDFSSFLVGAISKKVPKNGTIFLNHCTCYSDDRQVMEFDADRLRAAGYNVIIGAADHINFKDKKAYSILDGNECELDGIFRYTPVEWLMDIRPKRWQGYFNTETVACNHPVSLYAQTKRFPFVWDMLEAEAHPDDSAARQGAGRTGQTPDGDRTGAGGCVRKAQGCADHGGGDRLCRLYRQRDCLCCQVTTKRKSASYSLKMQIYAEFLRLQAENGGIT